MAPRKQQVSENKRFRYGPIPETAGYLRQFKPGVLGTSKKLWFHVDGAMLYSHPSKNMPADTAIGLLDARLDKYDAVPLAFKLSTPGAVVYLQAPDQFAYQDWIDEIKKASQWKLEKYYGVSSVLGKGSFAAVHMGYDKLTNEPVAIKVLKKKEFKPAEIRLMIAEYKLAKEAVHQNIVKVYDLFNSESKLCIVYELMGGGTLVDLMKIQPRCCLSESAAKEIIFGVLQGLRYLHSRGIAHRDIKPDNVMLKSRSSPYLPKLIDFGFVATFKPGDYYNNPMRTVIGTSAFKAPELLREEAYSPQVDMYSLGVTTYAALFGRIPFLAATEEEIHEMVHAAELRFDEPEWYGISSDAKGFIRSLMTREPEQRLTADAAQLHPWFDAIRRTMIPATPPRPKLTPKDKLKSLLLALAFSSKVQDIAASGFEWPAMDFSHLRHRNNDQQEPKSGSFNRANSLSRALSHSWKRLSHSLSKEGKRDSHCKDSPARKNDSPHRVSSLLRVQSVQPASSMHLHTSVHQEQHMTSPLA